MEKGVRQNQFGEPEDALMYLPRKAVVDFQRGDTIFDEHQPSSGLCLVVHGRVKVSVPAENGGETVVDIFTSDDFFGENALLGTSQKRQRAMALDDVSLMSWSGAEIEEQIDRQPRLAIALMQIFVRREHLYQERVQSFALDKTPERIVRALLRFGEHLGAEIEDGSIHIPPLTHQVISEYVGTSREIVTFQMNRLRKQGALRYSRRGIDIDRRALLRHLELHDQKREEPGVARPQGANMGPAF